MPSQQRLLALDTRDPLSRLVGHSGTITTEAVYRKQIRPVITEGADVMDRLFPRGSPDA